MKKLNYCLSVLFVLIISFTADAQQKLLTVEEATLGRGRQFNPEDKVGLQWQDNENFTYVKNYAELIQHNIRTGEEKTIITAQDINKTLLENKIPSLKALYAYSWETPTVLKFTTDNYDVLYDIINKAVTYKQDRDKNAANIHMHSSTRSIAYTIENNIFIKTSAGKIIQITSDEDKGIVNGSNYVHRQEFGINKGIFWSNSGRYMAFYRKDERMVADYPLVDVTKRIAEVKNIKYPMAGETSEEVSLGIYDIVTGKLVFIQPKGHKNDYLTRIAWDPSDKFIYIAELNRGQNHMHLNKYDATTGTFINTLFEEKNDKWVEPENDMLFLKTKPNQFVWQSERDGYNHLYLYDTNGKLLKQLTKGNFVITDIAGFDVKEENIYVMSTKQSPIERHLYRYNVKTGKETKLTIAAGMHSVKLSPDKRMFIDSYSNTTTPRNIDLIDNTGKKIKNLLSAKDPVKEQNYALGEMTLGTIKAADGTTDLHFRMIKPHNFNPANKYPVVVYVYGGPHAQLVTNSWLGGTGLFDYYLAQNGFIVFTVDNRGSADRGFAFESVIHRQNGQEEMKDQVKGVEYLASLPYVDTSRIGVSGWSYGGFMTTSLMLNYPDIFKVGSAGGPVIDWKFYEVMYGERYMDTPQENPEGYAKTSTLNKAKNLKGRLLMIHGDMDPVVVMQNSFSFLKAATDANVLVDYAVYPTHEHNVMGRDRVNLNKKIAQYFIDYLK